MFIKNKFMSERLPLSWQRKLFFISVNLELVNESGNICSNKGDEKKSDFMIEKTLEKALHLLQVETLYRRLIPDHPRWQEIDSRYRQKQAGFQGEKEVYYYLSLLPRNQFRIFHNLRLRDETYRFQIDFLILTKRFLLILEVKDFQGKVILKEFDQLLQVKDYRQEELHANPVSQVIKQK